jgi:DNA polymerase elongation subunit (family B)
MKIEFIPVDYDYFDFEGLNYVRMVGRTATGKRACVVDSYSPNFWGILKDGLSEKKITEVIARIEKLEVEKGGRESKVLKIELHEKKYLGKDVKALRIFVSNHKDMQGFASQMGWEEIVKRREYDLGLISKYIMENKVEPLKWYEVEGDMLDVDELGGIAGAMDVDVCLMVGESGKISLMKTQKDFSPRVLAYDIETDGFTEVGEGEILMVSLYGENFKKVLTWKKCETKQDFVECFEDEADMIEGFVEAVKGYSPDILTGYFSDGFDLPYLRTVAQRNKVKLSLGLDGKQPSFARGRIPSGKISGIVHVDLFRFIETAYSQYLKSETLGLGDVAQELLGEGKLEFDFSTVAKMKGDDWKHFFEYNLQDSKVTWELAKKLWPDMLELTKTVSEPLFNVTRYGLSGLVENYIIHNLEKFNEIVEKRPPHDEIGKRKMRGKVEGAFVLQPKPGLYEDLVMFDFTSMHTSIIISFNVSQTTLLEKKEKGCFESPEMEINGKKTKFYFSKEQGFVPLLLKDIFDKRKKFKEEYKKDPNVITKARSNVFKLLSASVHGYQGFFGARYYSHEAAAAVLAYVREFDKEAIDKIGKAGYEIVYSDTDSIAFLQGGKSKKDVLGTLKKINSELPGIMELDLEDFYPRGLFVAKRGGGGAKKKYALVDGEGKLKVRGFETVRRDWCRLARGLQKDVLMSVLEEGDEKNAVKIFKKIVEKLKERKVDLDDLMIKTQLKKALTEYIAQGPHVIAAKKMEAQGLPVSQGMLIEYFIGETRGKGGKKGRVRDRVFLPDEKVKYEIDYYLNNQLIPAVENILEVFGIDIKGIVDGESQKTLF